MNTNEKVLMGIHKMDQYVFSSAMKTFLCSVQYRSGIYNRDIWDRVYLVVSLDLKQFFCPGFLPNEPASANSKI